MPNNTFEQTAYVLDEVFIRFVNYLNFAKVANRNLEDDFKNLTYATGQTVNYRLEERYEGGEGATATAEDRVQVIRPLTVDKQFHSLVEFDGFELTFDRARDKPYLDQMLNPRAKTLANKVERYIASTKFQDATYQAVGTPGVALDFDVILDADAYMTELGIPEDGLRYFALPPRVSSSVSKDLQNSFNMDVNRGALMDGFIGHLSGFDFFKTNFLRRHTAGNGEAGGVPPTGFSLAGVVTNGPITSGSTIAVSGLGAGDADAFKKGDIIEVADASAVYMVNPLNQAEPLEQRAQFVVTADVAADGGGLASIPVSPAIVTSGARQNISQAIPNGAQLYVRSSHNVSIAFHNQALVVALPPIAELKGGVEVETTYSDLYKMAMTYSLGADIRNYEQLDRLDVLAGCAINPEFAVRVCS